jgi:hypothetical protein
MGLFSSKHFEFTDVWWSSVVQIVSKVIEQDYPWNKDNNIVGAIKSVGTLFKVNNNIYCIGTADSVRNAIDIKVYVEETYKNSKYEKRLRTFSCVIDMLIIDLNLCILKCDPVDFNNWALYNQVANINIINSECISINYPIFIMNVDYKILKNLNIKKTVIGANVNNIFFDNVYNNNFCKLPYYVAEIDKKKNNNNYLGCACINENGNLVGMINSWVETKNKIMYEIVSGVVLLRVLKEHFYNNGYKGLGIIKIDLINNAIVNTHNIMYKLRNGKHFCFKNKDIILSVDGIDVNKFGLIYDSELKIDVPFESYIALNKYDDRYINIKILRQYKKNMKIISKYIKPKLLTETFKTQYSYDWDEKYEVINLYGLNFVSPTIELLSRLKNDGILGKNNLEINKKLLLISVDCIESTKIIYKMFNHNIICNINNNYVILTLINKKKIKDKHDFIEYINKIQPMNKLSIMLNNINLILENDNGNYTWKLLCSNKNICY